jgi:ribonuclease I
LETTARVRPTWTRREQRNQCSTLLKLGHRMAHQRASESAPWRHERENTKFNTQRSVWLFWLNWSSQFCSSNHRPQMWRWSFAGVREFRDNSKPQFTFQQWNRGWSRIRRWKCTYLNELDVRKPLIVYILHKSEEAIAYKMV